MPFSPGARGPLGPPLRPVSQSHSTVRLLAFAEPYTNVTTECRRAGKLSLGLCGMSSYTLSSEGSQTFMFADLAGFTAMTEAHGDGRAAELASSFCSRMKDIARRHSSSVVKSIGDAVMIRSPQPREAVELALCILDCEHARTDFLGVRIGMNTGSAVERDSDWFGSGVNVAARVSAIARAGEILATDATREASQEPEDIDFQHLGSRSLKNVAEPIELYSVVRKGATYGALELDPVCRMTVGSGGEVGSLKHRGRVYRFCSLECAAQFSLDPRKFAVDG